MVTGDQDDDNTAIPSEYLGIPFRAWLDIFLEYSLMLALNDELSSAYEVLSSAYDANVFFHSQDSMFLIHVCWFSERSLRIVDTCIKVLIVQ